MLDKFLAGTALMDGGPTVCVSAAAPASKGLLDRQSRFQNSNDLERHGRGGRLHTRVGPRGLFVYAWH